MEILTLPPLIAVVSAGGAAVAGAGSAWLYANSTPNEVAGPGDSEDVLDPRADVYWESFHKGCVNAVGAFGTRNVIAAILVLPSSTLYHYDVEHSPGVRGLVAITIDDAPCRQRARSRNMVNDVRVLLAEFEAAATFFLCSDHVAGHEEDMVELLAEGHELANHCARDRLYSKDSEADFEKVFLQSEEVCVSLRRRADEVAASRSHAARRQRCEPCASCTSLCGLRPCLAPLTGKLMRREGGRHGAKEAASLETSKAPAAKAPVRWFRAPGGSLSSSMGSVLERHGFTHVLCDAYANDPWISDPEFIADTVLQHTADGSVIVLHMPERGFREYTFQALRKILDGLAARKLKSVTLSALRAAAEPEAKAQEGGCVSAAADSAARAAATSAV